MLYESLVSGRCVLIASGFEISRNTPKPFIFAPPKNGLCEGPVPNPRSAQGLDPGMGVWPLDPQQLHVFLGKFGSRNKFVDLELEHKQACERQVFEKMQHKCMFPPTLTLAHRWPRIIFKIIQNYVLRVIRSESLFEVNLICLNAVSENFISANDKGQARGVRSRAWLEKYVRTVGPSCGSNLRILNLNGALTFFLK